MTTPSINKCAPLTTQQIFMAAVHLINRITEIVQEENHHPDIHLTDFRKLRVELTTHDAKGLSDTDFIEAKRINDLPVES